MNIVAQYDGCVFYSQDSPPKCIAAGGKASQGMHTLRPSGGVDLISLFPRRRSPLLELTYANINSYKKI